MTLVNSIWQKKIILRKNYQFLKKGNVAIIFKKNQCVDINDQDDWNLANKIYQNKS